MIDPLPPYAELLALRPIRSDEGELIWVMPFRPEVIGRPGFLHGGAIAGLLEFAALGAVHEALKDEDVRIKPINVTCQYLRGGVEHDTYACAVIERLGRRVANVGAHAWQHNRAKPIASAQMNLLLRRG